MRISDWSSDVCSSDLRIEAVEILEGIDAVLVIGGLRRQRQRRSEVEVGVQFEDIGLGAIAGIAERGDFAQVARLRHAAIGIFGIEQADIIAVGRSEEHTSELQSLMRISYAVFCLKKKKKKTIKLDKK